jgi:hypothetical protein
MSTTSENIREAMSKMFFNLDNGKAVSFKYCERVEQLLPTLLAEHEAYERFVETVKGMGTIRNHESTDHDFVIKFREGWDLCDHHWQRQQKAALTTLEAELKK